MRKLYILCCIFALCIPVQAQTIDLLDVVPGDSLLQTAHHYEDSVRHKSRAICRWGKGDDRFSFPTLEAGLGVGRTESMYWDGKFFYTGLSLAYNPFQFSTYSTYNPCYLGGALRIGVYGEIQPQKGVYEGWIYHLTAWKGQLIFAFPLAVSVRINNRDEHQLTMGVEPEIGVGVFGPCNPGDYQPELSVQYSLRFIMQYKYKNLFFSLRPSFCKGIYEPIAHPEARFSIGWNFK